VKNNSIPISNRESDERETSVNTDLNKQVQTGFVTVVQLTCTYSIAS